MKKVMLIIRDGWGYSEQKKGNAILNGNTPFNDYLINNTEQVLVTCHGEQVGLPAGFQGSSEVGHLNMGAGRIVQQEVTRIFNAIESQSIFEFPNMKQIDKILETGNGALHFMGLLQNEGVHAHEEHLYQLYKTFRKRFPDIQIWIHPIADGRDTPPRSFKQFYNSLKDLISDDPLTDIGTVWGRYYGMDRSKNWDLIKIALDAVVNADGQKTDDFEASVFKAYENQKTPDNFPMFDEYLTPLINIKYSGMNPGDVLINFNYRQDRAIQISRGFCDPENALYQDRFKQFHYFGLTRYYNEFKNYLMPPMGDTGSMDNILGDVLSQNRKKQLRIAETQKFRHVTSFFNGKSTEPFSGEEQIEIPSEWDPSSFANHPEMNAEDVTEELLKRLDDGYDFIAVNYANCDMVGHTGEYEAAMKGAEIVDRNVEKVTRKALDNGYTVLITADHGNSEEMLDSKGEVKTSHTVNPVKLHILDSNTHYRFQTDTAILSDIASLVLKLMELPIPVEMTSTKLAESLIVQD